MVISKLSATTTSALCSLHCPGLVLQDLVPFGPSELALSHSGWQTPRLHPHRLLASSPAGRWPGVRAPPPPPPGASPTTPHKCRAGQDIMNIMKAMAVLEPHASIQGPVLSKSLASAVCYQSWVLLSTAPCKPVDANCRCGGLMRVVQSCIDLPQHLI